MAIGNHTFWIIVIDNEAITSPTDRRVSLRFRTSEAANLYATRHELHEAQIVRIRG